MGGRISTEELPRDEEAEENTSSVQVDELIQSIKSQLLVLPKLTTESASCSIFRAPQVFTDSDVNDRSFQPRTVPVDIEETIQPIQAEVDADKLMQLMQSKLPESAKDISKSAGRDNCCIFRVPQGFTDSQVNCGSYHPRRVSIGPYHRGKPHLKAIEEHKWRFLARVIKRTSEGKGVGLKDYVEVVKRLEADARESYSEDTSITNLKGYEFVEMLVLDGCFVIEMFRAFSNVVPFEKDDPFSSMQFLRDDFLCLENQIPYIVLQTLFTLTEMESDRLPSGSYPTLFVTALYFFRISDDFRRDPEVMGEVLHLLDLVRKTYFPDRQRVPGSESGTKKPPNSSDGPANIQCISKLRRAGIKLKADYNMRGTLWVRFKRGVIWMPELKDTMRAFLLNCVAFEQSHMVKDKLVSAYVVFLDSLIDTTEDVDILCEAKVLNIYLATQREVATFVDNLGKAAAVDFDIRKSYLKEVYADINKHLHNSCNIYLAEVKAKYFSSPWTAMSLFAAFYLLVLATAQTVFGILEYKKG
ncbi:unnamed protein product [Cuscuta epithymum]|uniref:Uncharacterized protein n=1 Tax=Cuscuta epithymum TaxID=186058 RepID=A0AAV0F4F8_9ASTE|nr:unnamed protein product [Cuscuta epithymum]